jgi:hypothetical protein
MVGVTLSTTLLFGFMSRKLQYHVSDYVVNRSDAFIFEMRNVYIVLVIVCAIGALFTAFRLYKNVSEIKNDRNLREIPDKTALSK